MAAHLLIANGNLVDGTGAAMRRGVSVLLVGDRIAGVGPEAELLSATSAPVTRIDATGCTVMPGLIDVHTHITLGEPQSNDELFSHREPAFSAILAGWQAQKLLRAGVTSAFDIDGIHMIGPAVRDAIEAGIIEGPRLKTGTHALMTAVGGTAGRMIPEHGTAAYAQVVRNKDEMVQIVRQQIKFGADIIKVHVTGRIPGRPGELSVWTEEELRVVCDTAHELGIPVTGHCRTARSTRDCLRAGMDIILHASFLGEGTGPQQIGNESKELLGLYEETLELLIEKKTPVVPTWTFLGNLSEFGHKVGASPTAMGLFRDEIQATANILKRAYDAGVPFLCGSETGFSITPIGQWHAREMELFVKYLGLSPLEAITCGTRNGAIAMGMEGRVGTVEVDRLADVLVVDGDPLNDIRILGDRSRFKAVISRGVQVDLQRPYPERRVLAEEMVSQYSTQPLTWDLVNP